MNKPQITPDFAKDMFAELKKVSWPTREETMRLTIVVVAISLIIGLYVGIIDILLVKALEVIAR